MLSPPLGRRTEPEALKFSYGCFPKLGVPLGGPNNKDYSMWGLYWGLLNWGTTIFPLGYRSIRRKTLFSHTYQDSKVQGGGSGLRSRKGLRAWGLGFGFRVGFFVCSPSFPSA